MKRVFDVRLIFSDLSQIIRYFPVSMAVLFPSIFFSLIAGILFYIIRAKKIIVLSQLVRVMMSYMRGVPVITQLFLMYFTLPMILQELTGVNLTRVNGVYFVVFTYAVYFGSGVAENIRASFNTVGAGQFEAAYSLGMSEFAAFRRIIFPQMIVAALPNFTNIFTRVLKNTSLAFSVGVVEMMSMTQLVGNITLHPMEAYFAVSIIYYILYLLSSRGFGILEKNVKKRVNMA